MIILMTAFKMLICCGVKVSMVWKPAAVSFFNGSPALRSYATGLKRRPVSAPIGFKNF